MIERWTTQGKAIYEILKADPGYGIEVSAQITWMISLRMSMVLLLTAKLWEQWSLSTSFRMVSQKIISANAEIVVAVKTGNMISMTNLLRDGRARPTDVLVGGRSLLHVGNLI